MRRLSHIFTVHGALTLLCILVIALCAPGCRTDPRPDIGTQTHLSGITDSRVRDAYGKIPYEEVQGFALYRRYCIHCHGSGGAGDGDNAYALRTPPRALAASNFQETVSDSMLTEMIRLGGRRESVSTQMPAYTFTLTSEEIVFLVTAVRSFHKNKTSLPDSTGPNSSGTDSSGPDTSGIQ